MPSPSVSRHTPRVIQHADGTSVKLAERVCNRQMVKTLLTVLAEDMLSLIHI